MPTYIYIIYYNGKEHTRTSDKRMLATHELVANIFDREFTYKKICVI